MLIPTNEVPQADDLGLVVKAVGAVGRGARTDEDLATAIGGYDPRQGRYYRRAAEILGFIRNMPGRNRSVLTQPGRRFLRSGRAAREELLAAAVLASRLIQRVIPFLESNRRQGASREDLRGFIDEVTEETTPAMVNRRLSTIVAWLIRIRMLQERGRRYFLGKLPQGVRLLEYEATDEPLLPRSYDLREYQSLARHVDREIKNITLLLNAAARERANHSHRMLTDLVADKIRGAGGIPKRNKLIDLSARLSDQDYLFEMKSTTPNNFHSQIRAAISQLYEYSYIYRMTNAKLVVVTENPAPHDLHWMVDYVVNDRKLLLAWDGDRRTFCCPTEVRHELCFLL